MTEPDELDRRIDERLRAAFTPPPLDALAERVAPAKRIRWPVVVALAAAAASLAIGVALLRRAEPSREALAGMWVAAYQDVASRGPGAPGCCEGPIDLPAVCEMICAARVRMKDRPGLELLGTYEGSPTGPCVPLVVDASGECVCVFVVPKGKDPDVRLEGVAGLYLHRRALGDVTLYELGRSREPRALEHFAAP